MTDDHDSDLNDVEFGVDFAARLAAARTLAPNPGVAERITRAPRSMVLRHSPEEIVREARRAEPLPRSGQARVAVEATAEPRQWRIDVTCLDGPGLLARVATAFADASFDILSASIATWDDGAVVDG